MRTLMLNTKRVFVVFLVLPLWLSFPVVGANNIPETAMANLPVKEVTVFKDGHAFVLHEGTMPTDNDGNVVLDYLPRPVIGTFWSYSAQENAELAGVVSGRKIVSVDRTALTVPELIRANIGAKVRIAEVGLSAYECVIYGIPSRSSGELDRTSPPSSPEELPQQGNVVLLKYEGGIKAVNIESIQEVTFLDEPEPVLAHQEFRELMTLKLDWDNDRFSETANVGMVYVQRGIRWIPNYRIEIDGNGQAIVKLQATIINELTDIENVKAHLVIGVPSFAFEETVDPISLQQTVAQLSSTFQRNSQTAYAFSNMIMSQQVASPSRISDTSQNRQSIDLGSDVTESAKNEDLYIFTLENITLKKGQRMVVPVAEYKLNYRDIFVLDLPFGPPPEVRQRFNNDQMVQLARLYHGPKVVHKIRITNGAECPLTTAPALILQGGRIIAQGMMTYTAIGATSDLELTTAIDISVEKLDEETERIPNAARWANDNYAQSKLRGTINLTNHRSDIVEIEVRRSVMGNIDDANSGGTIEHLGIHEGGWMTTQSYPLWWNWYSWPYWWYHFNPVGRVNWDLELEPGETIELEYDWHYFWRS
ncbi:hypothetical protein ACFLZ8_00575 [Planctomycetota bacterium]